MLTEEPAIPGQYPTGPEEPDRPPFLGVSCSLSGKAWRERSANVRMAQALSREHRLPEIVGRVLAGRDIAPETAGRFLEPTLRAEMPDPSRFRDMDKAADRLARAVMEGEIIAVFGDYDVDGATSSALMQRFLTRVGAKEVLVHIPDRMTEGYGPNVPALCALKAKGASVAVTVDCGITAFDVLEEAAGQGLDLLVVDHHVAEPRLPKIHAVVNPNRLDEEEGFGHLAAVGVVFLLLVAVNRSLRNAGWYHKDSRPEPDLRQWLDLVALGTVCDVVSLTGLNRAYVAQGLKVMAGRTNPGLVALGDVARIDSKPDAFHLGFMLGPRVNAGGRVGEAPMGARLLSCDSARDCRMMASQLDQFNQERQAIEAEVLEAAIASVEEKQGWSSALILEAGEGWHAGVIGIVAGRLKERFDRPAFVLGIDEEGIAKGSGRSVPGVDLGAAVIAARQAGILIAGGGHPMAAGLTVEAARIPELQAFLEERIAAALAASGFTPRLTLDGALSPAGADRALVDLLEQVGPFGSGNPKPRFALPNVRIHDARVVGERHVSCWLAGTHGKRLKAIAFRAMDDRPGGEPGLGEMLLNHGQRPWHLAGSLKADDWNGRQDVQFIIEDMADPATCDPG